MLNFFKKKNLKDFEKKQEFDIKLIGLVLAYEIASSDGKIVYFSFASNFCFFIQTG